MIHRFGIVCGIVIGSLYGCDPSDGAGDGGLGALDGSMAMEPDASSFNEDAGVVGDAGDDGSAEELLDASEALDASDGALDEDGSVSSGCEAPETSADAATEDAAADAGDSDLEAPAPLNTIPDGLWRAPAASLPSEGGYVYLASEPGDRIFQGQTQIFTLLSSFIDVGPVGANGNFFSINVLTDVLWSGFLAAPDGMTQLAPGYYTNTESDPAGALLAELTWSGDGRACTTVTGWFAIDHVGYRDSTLVELDLRFEQHCDGNAAALRGEAHWMADDRTVPVGPVVPPPGGLWQASVVPPAGNYIHLQSDPGDYVGAGITETYPGGSVSGSGNRISVSVRDWLGSLEGMWNLTQLVPGYYGNLRRFPFHNPAFGGLDWSGRGRGCNNLSGWFVIDDIAYECGSVNALDARLEIHCEHAGPALHVQIHYAAP